MNYLLDATGKKLGRLASEAAAILQGKKNVSYLPNRVTSDSVVIKNVSKLDMPLHKIKSKIYYHHTGYMGHLRKKTLEQKFIQSPAKVFRLAVERMLPKNGSRKIKLRRLTIEL